MNVSLTDDEWEGRLGEQVRAARIAAGYTQRELAGRASISLSTLHSIENGSGSSLRSLIRIARALGRADWLNDFHVTDEVSPLQLLRQQRAGERSVRRRVRGPRER